MCRASGKCLPAPRSASTSARWHLATERWFDLDEHVRPDTAREADDLPELLQRGGAVAPGRRPQGRPAAVGRRRQLADPVDPARRGPWRAGALLHRRRRQERRRRLRAALHRAARHPGRRGAVGLRRGRHGGLPGHLPPPGKAVSFHRQRAGDAAAVCADRRARRAGGARRHRRRRGVRRLLGSLLPFRDCTRRDPAATPPGSRSPCARTPATAKAMRQARLAGGVDPVPRGTRDCAAPTRIRRACRATSTRRCFEAAANDSLESFQGTLSQALLHRRGAGPAAGMAVAERSQRDGQRRREPQPAAGSPAGALHAHAHAGQDVRPLEQARAAPGLRPLHRHCPRSGAATSRVSAGSTSGSCAPTGRPCSNCSARRGCCRRG